MFLPVKYSRVVVASLYCGVRFLLYMAATHYRESDAIVIFILKLYALFAKKVNKQVRTYRYKENYSNFTVNKDHSYKKQGKRVVTYPCRCSSGHLIPIIHHLQV